MTGVEPRFLLDTNICIYLLAARDDQLRNRVEACDEGELVTSIIVYAEVMIGANRRGGSNAALALFDRIPPLAFDLGAGSAYADLPFNRGNFDRLIAAHAVSLGLALVTNNERDFADIDGLKVENWVR